MTDRIRMRSWPPSSTRRRGPPAAKVFFGMCPGVGKTYAMLSAAQQELRDGVDLVVGVVETHGRPEDRGPPRGLRVIPRKQDRLQEHRADRDGPRGHPGAQAAARPRRRVRPHERPGLAPSQALPGRDRAAGRRDRRLHDPQRAAHREPGGRGAADHRRNRAGDRARLRLRAGRPDRAGRHHARGPPRAPEGGQGVHGGARRGRRRRTSSRTRT
jgi:hypothetical protein